MRSIFFRASLLFGNTEPLIFLDGSNNLRASSFAAATQQRIPAERKMSIVGDGRADQFCLTLDAVVRLELKFHVGYIVLALLIGRKEEVEKKAIAV